MLSPRNRAMSFIPPLMAKPPGETPHPARNNAKKRSITERPELIGGVPLYLLTRVNSILSHLTQQSFPSSASPSTSTPTAPSRTPSETLHALAEHLNLTETALHATQTEVTHLRAKLRDRDASNNHDGAIARRLFTQLCRMQTRYTRAERELADVGTELKNARKILRSVEADLVVLWAAFLGLFVAFVGYIAGARIGG